MTDLATEATTSASPPRGKKRMVAAIKLILFLGVFALVIWTLSKQWGEIRKKDIEVHVRPLPLLLSLVTLIAVSTVQMISYRTLLGAYAHAPKWKQMLAVAWVPPLGKYIPGKVAALVAAMSMLRRFAIPTAVAFSVVLVLDGLAVIAGLITGTPLLFWKPIHDVAPWASLVSIPVVIAGIICLYPTVFGRLVNWLLVKLKKQPLPRMPAAKEYLIPVICAFAQWVFAGISLLWMVQSVTGELKLSQLPLMISFAALSQTLGYLALFAPGGLGPREAILLAALTPLVGPLAAVIVPIRAVAQILVDVALALLGLFILRRSDP